MPVVLGAPNILLGGSHSGNAAAEELVAAGCCTGLASDYAPPTLLAAAFDLANRKVLDFPAAVRLITAGPAEAAGLGDRGRLDPGCVADLALVAPDGRWPQVVDVITSSARHADALPGSDPDPLCTSAPGRAAMPAR
jgi:alpha-D-ribose 1-methylphosphonate 5-triphosphate diphosphatase